MDNDVVFYYGGAWCDRSECTAYAVAHCENLGSRFSLIYQEKLKSSGDVLAHRDIFDTNYGALYHPWLEIFDPLDKKNIAIPPSGSIMGIYARSDNTRGVHKAPANEGVRALCRA